jgi:glutathione S-transferase
MTNRIIEQGSNTMIRLHGMSRSNYYNLTKAVLLEKGISFEEVKAVPSQDEEFLSKSPMGKVPCLETDQGFISETFAIIDYVERLNPEPALLPADPYARAKVIELIRHIELDVELVARRCLPAAFFGADASEELKTSTERDLKRGMAALERLLVCDPYIAGEAFTLADLYAFFTFGLAGNIVETIFGTRLLDGHAELAALLERLAKRDSIRSIQSTNST